MKKEQFNFREAYERIDAIKGRLSEMAQNLENDKEREAFTEAEEGERKQLFREMDILEMKIKANTPTFEVSRESSREEVNRQMREAINTGQRFEVKLRRDWGVDAGFTGNSSTYAAATQSNPYGITTGDIVKPLYNKIILSAIGAPLLTGLKGNYQWPVVEAFEATVNNEGVALGDTRINLSKLTARPERIGIAVPITREALAETDDLIQLVATEYIPVAASALMNKIMFSATVVAGATNLVGPFVASKLKSANQKTYAGDAPTLADLTGLKAAILKGNVQGEGLCYVMNDAMAGLLEGTPKWANAPQAILENGRINGVPVFTTNVIADNTVYCGAFKYAPQGIFGDMSFIVDPYSQARKNAVDFVLNMDYAITVLRSEAFGTLTKAGA